jgi:hypothetical protein
MPVFAAFFGALFSALGGFLVKLFLAKVAMRVVAVGALSALTTALLVTFNGWIAPLVAQLFSTQYGQLLGLAFPPIAGSVVSLLLIAFLAVTTYKTQYRAIRLTGSV